MKRWIITVVSGLLVAFLLLYLFAFVPLRQWSTESNIDIHTAYFSALYTEARKKLGVFSGMFMLNHITINWVNQSDVAFLESIDFSFIHKVGYKMYDVCTVSFQTDIVTLSYMRDEPKGICNDLGFPYVNTEVDVLYANSLVDFMNSVSMYVNDWYPTVHITPSISGHYRTIISGNLDDTISITQTDDNGFTIR